MTLSTAEKSPALIDYLRRRRSLPLKQMGGPGPSAEQITTLLEIAARVPDHGRMYPWYFAVIEGAARQQLGAALADIYRGQNPDAQPAQIEQEAARFTRAPVVIAVVSRLRRGKNPFWEQILSAGAACYNLCIAANAMGFGTNWLTEWYAYDPAFKKHFGLDEQDHIAGFIYIGTFTSMPEERARPDMSALTTYWQPGVALNKGAAYENAEADFPGAGFGFKG